MSKNEILKLFPEPVFKYHIEDSKNLNSELSKYIYTLHDEDKKGIERSNRGGWHSKNFNISDKNSIQHKFALKVQVKPGNPVDQLCRGTLSLRIHP